MDGELEHPYLFLQLLGEFKVTLCQDPKGSHKFRSRTAEHLLAWIGLRSGRPIAKNELLDLLWPDSDSDRQAQNLRRAISDVRQVIEQDPRTALTIRSDKDRIWLDPDRFQTDVQQFRLLTDAGLEGSERESKLREALRLYTGPLLPGHEAPWVGVYRMELEERFGQAIEQMILLLLESGRHEEALRIGRQALSAAPLREDVHVALMRAYASAGMRSEAIRQFEELESLLEDHWGEPPSPKTVQAFESITAGALERAVKPVKGVVVGRVEFRGHDSSGGALSAGSPFYVVRECDRTLRRAIAASEGTILVHGPRQVGKTSLLGRVLNEVRRESCKVVVTDFQVVSRSQPATADSLSRNLAYGFATQLGVQLDLPKIWNTWIGPNSNLDAVVDLVLRQVEGSVVWAMDEVDLLFGMDIADDFFGLVRGWDNRRAMDEEGPFNRLSIVISYATEAHLFVRDINQSPFNIGVRIPMRDFDLAETGELSRRFGVNLPDGDVRRVSEISGGQPFLTRRALDAVVLGGMTIETLQQTAASEDGPFSEHLRRLLFVATRDDQTKAEVVRFLSNQASSDPRITQRLIAGGMLVRKPGGQFDFRVPAYREYLARYLI